MTIQLSAKQIGYYWKRKACRGFWDVIYTPDPTNLTVEFVALMLSNKEAKELVKKLNEARP